MFMVIVVADDRADVVQRGRVAEQLALPLAIAVQRAQLVEQRQRKLANLGGVDRLVVIDRARFCTLNPRMSENNGGVSPTRKCS